MNSESREAWRNITFFNPPDELTRQSLAHRSRGSVRLQDQPRHRSRPLLRPAGVHSTPSVPAVWRRQRAPLGLSEPSAAAGYLSRMLRRAATAFRLDFSPAHRLPALLRIGIATVAALAGSLIADWLLVRIGIALFPATRGYEHFQFADYAKLTVIGVLIACIAWPITTRISTSPRWLFTRMAYAVTIVLLLPDGWLWVKGQPVRAVGVLMVMHLAIAVVTYLALTRLAPERRDNSRGTAPNHSRDRLMGARLHP